MKLNFTTKRNANGNRRLLLIDTERREYSHQSTHWYSKEDFTEVTAADIRRIADRCRADGYTLRDYMTP